MGLEKIIESLKERIDNIEDDFDFPLDSYLEKRQYKKNLGIVSELVDDFFEENDLPDELEIEPFILWKGKEYSYLSFMFHPIDQEKEDYSFFLRVIKDQFKIEEFDEEFIDTHGQKCKVFFDDEYFYWGVYNTGRMVDFKINPNPPWRDNAKNQDVDGIMVLGKDQLEYLLPILEEYVNNEGLMIPDEGIFYDKKNRKCNIRHSSIATYEGMWIGDEEYYSMHLNIPKTKNIVKKIKKYLSLK